MRNDNYFLLYREYIIKKGTTDYALYDLNHGDIVSIDRELGQILELAEKGRTIIEISQELHINDEKIYSILNQIIEGKIGRIYPKRIYIEKYKKGKPYHRFPFGASALQKCFVALPSFCHIGCSACNSPALLPCSICSNNVHNANISLVFRFLERILKMNCYNIIFHGGDPISNLPQFMSVIKFCREHGYQGEIYVITNGTLINYEIMDMFSKFRIHPVIPLFSSALILSETQLMKISELAHQKNIDFILTLVTIESSPDVTKITKIANNMHPKNIWSAAIYDLDHKKNNKYPILLNTIARVTSDIYYYHNSQHPCLSGTIALSVNGDILPCPHLSTNILGNINDPNCIDSIFEDWGRMSMVDTKPLHDASNPA
jgi:MoaA/NifB/PqqE/SkfB family radical SAM enzyme